MSAGRDRGRDPLTDHQPAAARYLQDHPDPPHRLRHAHFTDDEFKHSIQDETGIKPPRSADSFTDPDVDVRQSLARVRTSPFIPYVDNVRGFVFDIEVGRLREVV